MYCQVNERQLATCIRLELQSSSLNWSPFQLSPNVFDYLVMGGEPDVARSEDFGEGEAAPANRRR